jgi:CheY-like chemotaxis protein
MQASVQRQTELRPNLVLCIDDELIGLKVRRMLLERAGYHVLSALEGSEGLEIFAREPVQAVVLDFAMPGMNGAEVAARMRQLKPGVPILLLTAYLGLPREVTSLGDVYMTKGEGAPVLLDKLDAMLSTRHSERASSDAGPSTDSGSSN